MMKDKAVKRKPRSDKGKARGQYSSHVSSRYKSFKMRANKEGAKVEIDETTYGAILKMPCFYCDGSSGKLDRKDYSEPYTEENTIACCHKCLKMKHKLSPEEFVKHLKKIYLKTGGFGG